MSFKPLYVVQEWSAKCFAGCPGCFRNFVTGPRDGNMSVETFERAILGIPRGTMILNQFHGESLLHPEFPYFVKRLKDEGLRLSMPASAFVGARHLPLLVGEGTPCYILIVSVDGFCEHSQSVRRGVISLERAEAFVDEALKLRGSRPSPWIAVRWVEGGQSEKEFELYLKKWLFEKKLDFILRSRMFNYGDEHNSPVGLVAERCHSLQEGNPVVLFNGDVLLCERVAARDKYILGNVNKDDWETLMSRREALTQGYPNNEPCRLCSAAYITTGFKGILELRHPGSEEQKVPIYFHNEHSQSFYSLKRDWSGISWSLK